MSKYDEHVTAAEDRVPWNQLIAYGMGGVVPIALFNIAQQLIGLLGNISLGLSAFWLGTIMIIPRLWEAFSDPVIGHLSDNTRTRWGRRRPYILVGGIAVALSFVAMWWIPQGERIRTIFPGEAAYNWFQLAYIMVGLLAFYTACNAFEIPHGALGMEMTTDPHERTKLFSAKSFLGNLFAMGTPWLILLANLEFFRGTGGDLVDGMRYVSLLIAAGLVPLTFWWFVSLREPGFATAREQRKSEFWHDMRMTIRNKTFLILTGTIFTLAMGFNFVGNFANYITIFYLYGGDVTPASTLLGINGTVWAVTALVAVFPLNWISKRLGKRSTLILAILLMCAAQLSKIFCYRRGILFQFVAPGWLIQLQKWLLSEVHPTIVVEAPYLVLIPTMLLAAGMLMFFTLGSSMVGDVCDEDELKTGTRSEGTYYSVFWWFIKMGTAFASFVTGALLVFTNFDETQNKSADELAGNLAVIEAEAELWLTQQAVESAQLASLAREIENAIENADKLTNHFRKRSESLPDQASHAKSLAERAESIHSQALVLQSKQVALAANPTELVHQAEQMLAATIPLRQQSQLTLFRLRLVEIGMPLALSIVSIALMLRYPLNEARCYEIKEALKKRRAEASA